MFWRILLFSLLLWLTTGMAIGQQEQTTQQQVESWRRKLVASDDHSLVALSELEKQPAISAQLIEELNLLLREGSESARRLAIRCLIPLGEKARPAVPGLIKNLDHSDYLFRAQVMQCLKTVGSIALPELKEALKTSSARKRASALSVMNSITTVDADLLVQLQNDPDCRVRISVAKAWKKHGKEGVERIIPFMKDPESVVAGGAALSLRFNFENAPLAIKHLGECLSRKDAGFLAAQSLESFGVEAKAEIPKLVMAYPLGYPNRYGTSSHKDFVPEVLDHIGPARIEDLELLRQILADENPNRRAIAANVIGQLGADGAATSPDLEKLFQSSMLEHLKILQKAATMNEEFEKEVFLWENDGHEESAKAACAAYWRVTRDTHRFLQMVEELATCWEQCIYWEDSPFAEFSENDVSFMLPMLERKDRNFFDTVNFAIYEIPAKAFSSQVLEVLRRRGHLKGGDLCDHARKSDKKDGLRILPWLLEDLEDNSLKLYEFVNQIERLKIRDPRVEEVFEKGMSSVDPRERSACLEGLAAIAADEKQAVAVLLSNVEKNSEFRRTVLEALLKHSEPDQRTISFATDCLSDSDGWVRHRAIALLARIGPAAIESVPSLNEIFNRESKEPKLPVNEESKLQVAIALACITGDKSEFQRRYQWAIQDKTDDGKMVRCQILNFFAELGPNANRFMDEITELIQFMSVDRESDHYLSPGYYFSLDSELLLLGIVGSPRSIDLLKTFQNDRNWKIQNRARRILKMIEEGEKLSYDTYIR